MRIKRDANKASHSRNDPNRLARECAKLDKLEEHAFAEFGMNSETDWSILKKMKDEEIDLFESPEIPIEMFAEGIVRRGLKLPPKKRR